MLRAARNKSAHVVAVLTIAFVRDAMVNYGFAQCSSDTTVAAARLGIVVDGVRIVHLGVPSSWPDNVKTAISHAIDIWNAKTSTTAVRFTTEGTPDVTFRDAGQNNHCADYRSGTGNQFIDVSQYLLSALTPTDDPNSEQSLAAASRIDKARYPMAHEIGHTMNLADNGDSGSIMSVPDYVQCNGTAIDGFPVRGVSDGDATNAKSCVAQVIPRDETFNSDGSADYKDTQYDCECECWTQYEVVVGYMYADAPGGYVQVELYRYEIGSGCGPIPM